MCHGHIWGKQRGKTVELGGGDWLSRARPSPASLWSPTTHWLSRLSAGTGLVSGTVLRARDTQGQTRQIPPLPQGAQCPAKDPRSSQCTHGDLVSVRYRHRRASPAPGVRSPPEMRYCPSSTDSRRFPEECQCWLVSPGLHSSQSAFVSRVLLASLGHPVKSAGARPPGLLMRRLGTSPLPQL